nr:hypothetical protein [Streptomyces phytophilus]
MPPSAPGDPGAPPVPAGKHRIADVRVTPVAFRDLPLLNTVGVHEPFALRTVVEVVTDSGAYGLGDRDALARLHRRYVDCGIRERDDTGCMRRFEPGFEPSSPRW